MPAIACAAPSFADSPEARVPLLPALARGEAAQVQHLGVAKVRGRDKGHRAPLSCTLVKPSTRRARHGPQLLFGWSPHTINRTRKGNAQPEVGIPDIA